MLKNMAEMLFGEKKCDRCGSKENVRQVAVSSFSGRREYKWLCPKCALLEKAKVY
ncbi:MAG: hypothetical protein MSS66_04705 [Selenomonadaceae bacterium]|nr:hypothetical protein [Selenomonadaceae bacterium]